MAKLERDYQSGLLDRLVAKFPGIIIVKSDPGYIQGFPDLMLFYKNKWAWLEVKRAYNSSKRPNQDYYIDRANDMGSTGLFVHPENEREVFDVLERAFGTRR